MKMSHKVLCFINNPLRNRVLTLIDNPKKLAEVQEEEEEEETHDWWDDQLEKQRSHISTLSFKKYN